MRFNEKELKHLATQYQCEKEGNLYFRECQEGFFRRTEINNLKWCRLVGNLLFIFKTNDQYSEPTNVIILENISNIISLPDKNTHFFVIEFGDGQKQLFEAKTESERNEWVQVLRCADYSSMRDRLEQMKILVETRRGTAVRSDFDMENIQQDSMTSLECNDSDLWETSVSCDSLMFDANGKSPSPIVIVQIRDPLSQRWINYGKTEMIEKSSNANFFTTILFRKSDGVDRNSKIRVSVYDVREKVSQVSVPLGFAEISMCNLMESKKQRVVLVSNNQEVGFITLSVRAERFKHSKEFFYDSNCDNTHLFLNPTVRSYRFISEQGHEISIFDWMIESQLSFVIPQQLLSIWISREKEIIQEISGIGELDSEWKTKQMRLLDIHLRLLKNYSHAKKAIQNFMCLDRRSFKPSARKGEESLEFIPVNLHLQRMCVTYDRTQNKSSKIYDIITVGAFTKHSSKTKTGGLLRLLHQLKDSPSTSEQIQHRIQVANDIVQSIKQLRREVVEKMCKLISLARTKTIENMLPLCQMIIEKTRSLVTIIEPSFVDTAFRFIEEHRIASESVKTEVLFEHITQKISDLTSPEIEDFLHTSMNNHEAEFKGQEDFYQPTEEPEPLELTQLNLEASVMCLVSKVKLHCGRIGSPAVRIRQPLNSTSIAKYGSPTVDTQYYSKEKDEFSTKFETLINMKSNNEWIEELRPAMKKLSQAMDGLLKTARLVHSVHSLQQDMKKMTSNMSIIYHRDVCFSQSLTSLITALMAKFWNNRPDQLFIDSLCSVGPLAYFEGYLSLYGNEWDFWSDMNVAVEDLGAVNFSLVCQKNEIEPIPQIYGSRQALFVKIPVPEKIFEMLPQSLPESFKVTVVFFNIGINEKATLAETLGYCKEQARSNLDNYEKLKIYFMQYRKLKCTEKEFSNSIIKIQNILHKMEHLLKSNTQKNIDVLKCGQEISRLINGMRFTSCKSAKDRTSMAVTLEQTRILSDEYQLSEKKFQPFLDVLRRGTRLENTNKNINKRLYAFSVPQVLALPSLYRPPASTYGKTQS